MNNLKSYVFLLGVFFIQFTSFSSVYGSDKGKIDLEAFQSGLSLKAPLIRKTPKAYLASQEKSGAPSICIFGEGHIEDFKHLPAEFREDGDQELTTSNLDGKLAFHANPGVYTVSAELNKAFNSDWIGDLTNPSHRKDLFDGANFGLVFDATYHPNAISLGLFPDVYKGLKPGGWFVMPINLELVEGKYVCGHRGFKHEMPYFSREAKFDTKESAFKHWEGILKEAGFKSVKFYDSPFTFMMNDLFLQKKITTTDVVKCTPEDAKVIEESVTEKSISGGLAKYSKVSILARKFPHLAHYGLSSYYFIAEK